MEDVGRGDQTHQGSVTEDGHTTDFLVRHEHRGIFDRCVGGHRYDPFFHNVLDQLAFEQSRSAF